MASTSARTPRACQGTFDTRAAPAPHPSTTRRVAVARSVEPAETVSSALIGVLQELGVEHAFGLVGGAIAPFADALGSSDIDVLLCRHEGGAAFAAVEAYFASGRPAMVFTTTGPGVLNALTGMSAARWEGAKVVLIAGATASQQRGRWACQETSSHTMPASGVLTAGPIFDYAVTLESPAELEEIARRLAMGFARPTGFVAHIGLPLTYQQAPVVRPRSMPHARLLWPGCDPAAAAECAQLLEGRTAAIWVGHGALGASEAIRALAERLDVPVMCSPRGKGVFPEDHPLFLGVTGMGGHPRVDTYMRQYRPDYILVLGTRLGELTSFWRPELSPARAFLHVDLDPTVPGVAYPNIATVGIQAEVGAFVRALLAEVAGGDRPAVPSIAREPAPVLAQRPAGPVRPQYLMQEIQRIVIDGSDALVMTEAGNALAWGNHHLRFQTPGRYRVSTGFGSMGHFTTGVLGAALARKRPAVAIIGDGAMLMNNEVSTAVARHVASIWIVLNDSRYGMVHQGMSGNGLVPLGAEIPPTDFVAMARAMGARGVRVAREADVAAALETALADGGPFVVDVEIDRDEVAPHFARIASLGRQKNQISKGKQS
ncbi:thiamine pyrophosphate-dependent enzyme [Sorangium sp. So ce296]|uniref:thiamine pyrophosphate-dependent enzyme n=1 Tax=Sorangium sp. So ce296 TaxID=3133296 RepID=UPI003F5DF5B9